MRVCHRTDLQIPAYARLRKSALLVSRRIRSGWALRVSKKKSIVGSCFDVRSSSNRLTLRDAATEKRERKRDRKREEGEKKE